MKNKFWCIIAGILSLVAVYPAYLDRGVWAALACLSVAIGCGVLFFVSKGGK